MRRIWLCPALLALGMGCIDRNMPPYNPPPRYAYQAVLEPAQTLLRPGGAQQVFRLRVKEQNLDTNTTKDVDLRTWVSQQYSWKVEGAGSPSTDWGRFQFPTLGNMLDANRDQFVDPSGMYLQQIYEPPAALPAGTTQMTLTIRATLDQAEATSTVTIDLNAPLLPPSSTIGQE